MTPEKPVRRPLYARALRLRHLKPSGLWCFLYFEGMIALGALLALTELVNWWSVLVLPAAVAVMVKVNDVIAGAWAGAARPTGPGGAARPAGSSRAGRSAPPPTVRQVSRDLADTMDPVHSTRQRFRQSARRRYH